MTIQSKNHTSAPLKHSAQARVAATGDLFLRRFTDIWIVLSVLLWVVEISTSPNVQYPGIVALLAGLATKYAIIRKHLSLARYFIVGFMSAFILIAPGFIAGVRTPLLIGLAPMVFLCGWLLGRKSAAILTTLFCLAIAFYWLAEEQHWIAFNTQVRPSTEWFVAWVTVIVVTGFAVSFMINNIEFNFYQQEKLKEQLSAALEQARRLGDAMETVPSYVYMKDTEGRYTYVNGPMCELFGHTRDEILGVTNESFLDWSVSDDSHKNDLRVLDFGEYLMTEEVNVLAATGEARSYWVVKSPIKNDTGAVIGMCGISTDITENKRNQEELKLAKQAAEAANRELSVVAKFNETILLNSPLPMGVYTASGQCVVANDAYAKLVGKSRESLLTENFYDIDEWKISGALECCVRAIAQHSPQQIEIELKTPAGNVVYAECRMLPTQLNNGDHILIQLIDLTARKLHEIELSKFAFNDSLTQLPNRRLFLDRLKHAQSASQRDQNHGAILFLDLNKFKYLNDTHGHEAGDQLLVEVAKRLKLVTRDVDTVARFGGDEFVVLIDGLGQDVELAKENAAIAADKIKKSLSEEYVIGEIRHHGSASVGIALFLGDADDPDQIIKDADAAMYEAKKARGSS